MVDPLSELMVDDFRLSEHSGRVDVVPEDTLLPLVMLLLPARYFCGTKDGHVVEIVSPNTFLTPRTAQLFQ